MLKLVRLCVPERAVFNSSDRKAPSGAVGVGGLHLGPDDTSVRANGRTHCHVVVKVNGVI